MAKTEKTKVYLLSIVGIVAVVGVIVLILNAGVGGLSTDLSGQAINLKNIKPLIMCIDSDGDITDLDYVWYEYGWSDRGDSIYMGDIFFYGHDEFTKGTTSGPDRNGKYVRMEDICGSYHTYEILEGHCLLNDDGSGYYAAQGWANCDHGCHEGACVED